MENYTYQEELIINGSLDKPSHAEVTLNSPGEAATIKYSHNHPVASKAQGLQSRSQYTNHLQWITFRQLNSHQVIRPACF